MKRRLLQEATRSQFHDRHRLLPQSIPGNAIQGFQIFNGEPIGWLLLVFPSYYGIGFENGSVDGYTDHGHLFTWKGLFQHVNDFSQVRYFEFGTHGMVLHVRFDTCMESQVADGLHVRTRAGAMMVLLPKMLLLLLGPLQDSRMRSQGAFQNGRLDGISSGSIVLVASRLAFIGSNSQWPLSPCITQVVGKEWRRLFSNRKRILALIDLSIAFPQCMFAPLVLKSSHQRMKPAMDQARDVWIPGIPMLDVKQVLKGQESITPIRVLVIQCIQYNLIMSQVFSLHAKSYQSHDLIAVPGHKDLFPIPQRSDVGPRSGGFLVRRRIPELFLGPITSPFDSLLQRSHLHFSSHRVTRCCGSHRNSRLVGQNGSNWMPDGSTW